MATPARVQRSLLVFSIWATPGLLGGCFVLEGFNGASIWTSLLGIALIVAAACSHIVVNAIFGTGFTFGEASLGAAVYGVAILVFIIAWLAGNLTATDYVAGLALFGVLAVGFIAYVTTRYGLRSAFSRFHVHELSKKEGVR